MGSLAGEVGSRGRDVIFQLLTFLPDVSIWELL